MPVLKNPSAAKPAREALRPERALSTDKASGSRRREPPRSPSIGETRDERSLDDTRTRSALKRASPPQARPTAPAETSAPPETPTAQSSLAIPPTTCAPGQFHRPSLAMITLQQRSKAYSRTCPLQYDGGSSAGHTMYANPFTTTSPHSSAANGFSHSARSHTLHTNRRRPVSLHTISAPASISIPNRPSYFLHD